MKRISVLDTSLRDGEQVPGAALSIEQKIRIAEKLEELGVDIIEAGFPASSPGDFQAVSMIAERIKKASVTALARAREKDIDAVWHSVKKSVSPLIHIVLGSSDQHIKGKFKISRDDCLVMGVAAVKYAKKYCPNVQYSTEDASRSDPDYLCRTIEAVIKAGATCINIPDTVGWALPEEWAERICLIRERVPATDKVKMSVHCHNDLGMATINTLTAVKEEIDQVEVTVNGIGERAGNAALEEVVMAIKLKPQYFQAYTDIQCEKIASVSQLLSREMGIPIQVNKAITGANAFRHSSGIHQDGILKDSSTYEIMKPEMIGLGGHQLVLSARSGRHALREKLRQLGITFSPSQFEDLHQAFLKLADSKKEIDDKDLLRLVKGQKESQGV